MGTGRDCYGPFATGLKACLFDFGGTLDADGVPWQDRFYALFRKHGFHVDREVFRQAFYESDDRLAGMVETRDASLVQTVEALAAGLTRTLGLGRDGTGGRAIAEDFLWGTRQYVKRNRRLLEALKHHYRLGIVSNFYGNLDRVCEELGIRHLFACIVDSTRERIMKPDPRIFRAALARLGLEPAQAVFVGDNPSRDLAGAKEVGMPHVWLAGKDADRATPCCPGDPVIRSLEELGPLLLDGRVALPGE